MKLVDLKPKKKEVPKASDIFQSLADSCMENEGAWHEETGEDLEVEVVALLLGPYGLEIVSNSHNPDGINMILDIAKMSILQQQFEGGADETYH